MAKVMVSLPDEVLAAADVEATRRGTTRSGLLRQLTEQALSTRSVAQAARMSELDAQGVGRYGGRVAELVKATRPSR